MRRIIGILAIAAALVVGNLTLASATSSSSSDAHRTKTLHLIAKQIDEVELDLGEQGFTVGDQFIFTDKVFQAGKRVGEDHGVCTITRIRGTGPDTRVTVQCLVTLVLRAGQITVQGVATFRETGAVSTPTFAITGGTGKYRTAHGQVTVREISPTKDRLTVELIL